MPSKSVFEASARRRTLGLEAKATSQTWSEFGVSALMPWADRLFVNTYLSASNDDTGSANADNGDNGAGSGLFSIDKSRRVTAEHIDGGCHTGRYVHKETNYLFMGSCRISPDGTVTPIPKFQPGGEFGYERVTAYCRALNDTTTTVLAFTMNGLLYSVDIATLNVTFVPNGNAATALGVNAGIPHGKSAWKTTASGGRILVSFNNDPSTGYGRIGSFDGTTWTNKRPNTGSAGNGQTDRGNAAFINISGGYGTDACVFATGHDDKSVLLEVFDLSDNSTTEFRLPFGGDMWQAYFQQEWMRCRQVESERMLLDAYGMFWEIAPQRWGSTPFVPRIRALGQHSRIVPDFAIWDGALVLAGNHHSSIYGNYSDSGQSSGSLLFLDSIDELRRNPPRGYGYWWRNDAVNAAGESVPMCAAGMGDACIHLNNHTGTATTITIYAWLRDRKVTLGTVSLGANAYDKFLVPTGYRCDWFSVASSAATTLTARVDFT